MQTNDYYKYIYRSAIWKKKQIAVERWKHKCSIYSSNECPLIFIHKKMFFYIGRNKWPLILA